MYNEQRTSLRRGFFSGASAAPMQGQQQQTRMPLPIVQSSSASHPQQSSCKFCAFTKFTFIVWIKVVIDCRLPLIFLPILLIADEFFCRFTDLLANLIYRVCRSPNADFFWDDQWQPWCEWRRLGSVIGGIPENFPLTSLCTLYYPLVSQTQSITMRFETA